MARDVFQKLKCAAEAMLIKVVPQIITGQLEGQVMDLQKGSYFGGRKPEDGQIDWSKPAQQIHNLVRAVAPPFPGAFFDAGGRRLNVLFSYYKEEPAHFAEPCIYFDKDGFQADCVDGYRFMITQMEMDGKPLDEAAFSQLFGSRLLLAGNSD
jgi:methionyl-tRNA formyltransferase